jgi:hypothetical protein
VTKRKRRGVTPEKHSIPRVEYLRAIRGRLEGEVGAIIDCLEERNQGESPIGFFALARLILPIIESVADSEGRHASSLLEDLGQGAPNLSWDLYRNAFSHGDELLVARAGSTAVGSGLVFSGYSDNQAVVDQLARDGRTFDPARAYRRLLSYLDEQIAATSADDTVSVTYGLCYDRDCASPTIQKIVAEIDALDQAARSLDV